MKGKSITFGLLVLLSISLFLSFSNQKKIRPKDLPDRFRKWLEEEVLYIITPKEKNVFLQLERDRERDLFIEAFWKHRILIQTLLKTNSGMSIIVELTMRINGSAEELQLLAGEPIWGEFTLYWANQNRLKNMKT